MASKNIAAVLLPVALMVAPAWAGHVTMVNNTGQQLKLECGKHHDDEHAERSVSRSVSPGNTGGVSVHEHGDIKCRAKDDHGNTVDSKEFDFHDSDDAFVWQVKDEDGHHHDGDDDEENAAALEKFSEQIDVLKGLFGGGGEE